MDWIGLDWIWTSGPVSNSGSYFDVRNFPGKVAKFIREKLVNLLRLGSGKTPHNP